MCLVHAFSLICFVFVFAFIKREKINNTLLQKVQLYFKISTLKIFSQWFTTQKLTHLWYMQQENAKAQKQNIHSNVILSIKQAQHLARNCKACQENYGSKNVMYMVGGTVCGKSGFCLNEDWIATESMITIQYKWIWSCGEISSGACYITLSLDELFWEAVRKCGLIFVWVREHVILPVVDLRGPSGISPVFCSL